MTPREQKRIESMSEQIARLERALSRMGTSCACCNEIYPSKYPDWLHTSKGYVCLECLMHDEDALEGRMLTTHEINRHLKLWRDGWISWATLDGKRVLTGASLTYRDDMRTSVYAPKYWQPACVLMDCAESHNIKTEEFHDPRKFTWDGHFLVPKHSTHTVPTQILDKSNH